jgi:uncharacterized lipoprotein YddW (UPF0748 family)
LLKAVWLTNVDSQVMSSRQNLKIGFERLAELGFNTIYPVVWQRGYTLYPSQIAQSLTGSLVLPNSPFVARDVLAEMVDLASLFQMRLIPWFEYGLMVPPQSQIACQYQDLLMLDVRGNTQRIQGANGHQDPHAWLNPCHDRVCEFMVSLITDLVARYPVSGIQLDDHFSFPVELGYDLFTQQLFEQQHLLNWDRWRSTQLTNLLQQIVNSVRSVSADCVISISPNPLGFSQRRYLVDWQQWGDLGLIDELVLQVYRDRLDLFQRELNQPELRAIKSKVPTLIGILTGLRTRSISTKSIGQQVDLIIAQQFAGFACFFYETLLHEQLAPTLVTRDRAQLIDIITSCASR